MQELQGNNGQWTVRVQWLEEGVVTLVEYIGNFDNDSIKDLNIFVAENFLAHGQGPVHNIIDAKQLGDFPKNLNVLREGSKHSVEHPNAGWNILVGFNINPVWKFLSSAVSQVLGVKFKQVDTIDEAKRVLQRIDKRLDKFA